MSEENQETRNEIVIYLKDKHTKLFFELISSNVEVPLPLLFKKIPRSSLYRILDYVKEYEALRNVKILKKKGGISQNYHLMKIIQGIFPIQIVDNFAVVDVSEGLGTYS